MRKIVLSFLCFCILISCKQANQEEDATDFFDDVETMWYRFSRREDGYSIECSTNRTDFSQMRICHMYAATDEISFGIYACSPEESSFTAVFTDMKITECAWKAHDGQQPDEEEKKI